MRIGRFFDNIFVKRRKKPLNPILVAMVVFFLAIVLFNVYTYNRLKPKQLYYMDTLDATFPIIYQIRNEKMINEMRGFANEKYNMVSNDTITMLDAERKLTLLIKNNKNVFNAIEYEIRDKTSNSLLERTKFDISEDNKNKKKDETKITLNIQNLIKVNTTYLLTIKINANKKEAYYFANIIYRPKNDLNNAINQVEDFTKRTFKVASASSLVQYLETSINRDTREMHTVTLQQTFEQLTFADTKMQLVSDLYYSIYQAQEYSYNIAVRYLAKSAKNEFFIIRDEYVLRWDGKRWYYMKFTRGLEELIDIEKNPYNDTNKRFYTGVTNPSKLVKLESENKRYFVFCKEKEMYIYDNETQTMTNIFSYHIRDKAKFEEVAKDFDIKLLNISDEGEVTYIVYGYNMTGLNEGSMGIGIYTYNSEINESEEKLFIPIYTTL